VGKLGHRFYVIGGFTQDSQALLPTNLVEIFDASTKTWTRGPDFPTAIHHAVGLELDSNLYVPGGMTQGFAPTATCYVINELNPVWIACPPLPSPRGAHAGAVLDGRLYIAGGVTNPAGDHPREVFVYDPREYLWQTVDAPIPTPRDHTAGVGLEGRVYVVAGDTGGHNENTNATESFDPLEGKWERLAPVPTLRGSISAVAWRGHVVVLGGQNGTQTFDAAEAYNVTSNEWLKLPPMHEARHGFGAGVLDDELYVFYGGPKPGLSVMSSVERLSLSAPTSG